MSTGNIQARNFRSFLEHYEASIRNGNYPFPYARTIDLKLTEVKPGYAVVELDVDCRHENTIGTVHGGVYCSLADTATGIAHGSLLDKEEGSTTVDLKIDFLRPVKAGRLKAVATVIKHGRTLTLVECDILDADGRLAARASSTCMTLRGKPNGFDT